MSNKLIFTSAAEAEAAFYDAITKSDLEALMAVWSEDEEVVCVHPDNPRLVGLAAVRESWRLLFSGNVKISVRTSHCVVTANAQLEVHNVVEHIAVEGEKRLQPPMIATNVYIRGPLGWRLVTHHASAAPDSPHAARPDAPRIVH